MSGRRVATTAVDKADAVQRALRTLWQGFGLDAATAIGAGLVLLLADADVTSGVFWGAFGILVIKSLLMSLASYLQRLRKAPPPLPESPRSETASRETGADYARRNVGVQNHAPIYSDDGKE